MNLIEILNTYIGADAATYIGTALGIVALFWGGNKLINKNKQNINIKTNDSSSIVIQQVKDSKNELTFEGCERLFSLLLNENLPKLEKIAKDKAIENSRILIRETYQKLDKRIDDIQLSKLAEPDVQNIYNKAVQSVALKGNKIDINLLSELLEYRIEKGNDDYLDNCIDSAIEKIPKLTNELLAAIAVTYTIELLKFNTKSIDDDIFKSVNNLYLSQCKNITVHKIMTIASLGIATIQTTITGSSSERIIKNHSILNVPEAEKSYPHAFITLKYYQLLLLDRLLLNDSGIVIGKKLMERVI